MILRNIAFLVVALAAFFVINPASPQTSRCATSSTPGTGACAHVDNGTVASPYPLTNQLSPLDYGAKCDGTTDDSTAITNWAAAVVSGSDAVLPNSSCLFKTAIAFPNVNYWTIRGVGEQSQLLYAGATTTGNIVTFGDMTTGAPCSSKGMQIKNFRVMSNTVMTSGVAVALGHLCEAEIVNFKAGADLDGSNANWYNAVQFYGGNTIHMRGYSFRGSNIAEIVSGDDTNAITDLFQAQGKLSHSTVGLNIAGWAGGFSVEQSDILLNSAYNVLVDQSVAAHANLQIMFGPQSFVDATSGTSGVGFYLNDAGNSTSSLSFSDTWLASAVAGGGDPAGTCLLIETDVQYKIVLTGGYVTNCHNDGIRNKSVNTQIQVNGTFIRLNTGYGFNNTVTNNNINVVAKFANNTSGSFTGLTASQLRNDANSLVVMSPSGTTSKFGIAGACGLWAQDAILVPGAPDSGSAGCTYALGTSSFPFATARITTVTSDQFASGGAAPTNSGACSITTQSGGATAGRFVASGACAGSTLVFSMPSAAHGWACKMSDFTTTADVMNQTATTVNSATFTGSMANNDVMTFLCLGY